MTQQNHLDLVEKIMSLSDDELEEVMAFVLTLHSQQSHEPQQARPH